MSGEALDNTLARVCRGLAAWDTVSDALTITRRFHEIRVVPAIQTPLHPRRSSQAAFGSHERVYHGEEVVHVAAQNAHEMRDGRHGLPLLLQHGSCSQWWRRWWNGDMALQPNQDEKKKLHELLIDETVNKRRQCRGCSSGRRRNTLRFVFNDSEDPPPNS